MEAVCNCKEMIFSNRHMKFFFHYNPASGKKVLLD